MKKKQLQELIRHITRSVLKEFTSMSSISSNNSLTNISQDPTQDSKTPPTDAMTSAEKAKADRDQEHQRQTAIKQKQVELDAHRKEMEFRKKQMDQMKRFDIPNRNKELQRLKGAHLK